jgi:hypothetical protein
MKLKFNLDVKNIDYKQFFLKYGEWIGLGIALLITLPVIYSGIMKAVTSGSSKTNAAELAKWTEKWKGEISSKRPSADLALPPPATELRVDVSFVDANKFAEENPYIVPSKLEDDKRREPVVLSPSDFHVDFIRAGILGNEFWKDGKSIKALVLKETEANQKPRKRRLQNIQQGLSGGFGGGPPGAPQGPPGIPGMGQGGGMGPGGMGPGGMGGGRGFGGQIGQQQQQRKQTSTRAIIMDLNQIEKQNDVRLAEVMYPVRMAVVTAAFPYKEQMEAFRTALRMKSLNELVDSNNAPFVFKGATVMRRVYSPNGKLLSDWEDYTKTLKSEFAQMMARVPEPASEDGELAKFADQMIVPGLVMPRLPLARGEYPKIEIPSLEKSIKALSAADKDAVKPPKSFLRTKVESKGFDPFDPHPQYSDEEPEKKPEPKPQAKPRDNATASAAGDGPELLIPEYVLLRFLDVTVRPGYSYEYKVKLRMENPNHLQKSKVAYRALAENELIEAAEFTPVPKVTIPYDVSWYVTDEEGNRDQSQVQIHHWLEDVVTNAKDGTSQPVGDWSVLEKLDAHRGEYIGHTARVQVPVWNTEEDSFVLARTPDKTSSRIPVDFTVRPLLSGDPALLVDYDGGRSRKTFEGNTVSDEGPVRFLVYTPEGKLVVRTHGDEKAEAERKARVDEVKKAIADARQPKKRNGQVGGSQGPQGLFDNKGVPGRGGLGGQ